MRYVVLLRGINVGGRNKVPMAGLREVLSADFRDVRTYIRSGNVVLDSTASAAEVASRVEELLPATFALDSALVRTLVLDPDEYAQVVAEAPAGFAEDAATYRFDVGFFVGATADDIRPYVPVNPDVDVVAWGSRAFYHRRLIALASKSRLSRVVGTKAYASLTLRNWRTTMTLHRMLTE